MEKELSKGEKAILELGLYVAHPINLNVLLTQNERDVLESIRHCINNGENYVSITVLQAMTRLSESSVRRARDSLIELGLITKEDAATRKAQYVKAYQSDKDTLQQYRKAITDWNTKVRNAEQTGIVLHKAESLRDFAVGAAKIVELLTGDTGLVKMAEKFPEVGF
jgi:predicted transcriptional regulator